LNIEIREACICDVTEIQRVRNSVHENILSDPAKVTDAICVDYITNRGKGWVAVVDDRIVGFVVADLQDSNLWALFVESGYEKLSIGSQLLSKALEWYFAQGKTSIWLNTEKGTQAENFYKKRDWKEVSTEENNEVKLKLSKEDYLL